MAVTPPVPAPTPTPAPVPDVVKDVLSWVERARRSVTVTVAIPAGCVKITRTRCAGMNCNAVADCIPAGERQAKVSVDAVDLDALREALLAAGLQRADAPELLDMDALLRRAAAAGLVDTVVEVDLSGDTGYAYFASGAAAVGPSPTPPVGLPAPPEGPPVMGPCRGRVVALVHRDMVVMARLDVECGVPPLAEVYADPQWLKGVLGA